MQVLSLLACADGRCFRSTHGRGHLIAIPNSDDTNSIRTRNTDMIRKSHEKIAAVQVLSHRLTVTCKIGDAMAPILCIPAEILVEIFVQCIPSLHIKCSSQTTNTHLHPQDIAELLGDVCQRWRTIVNNTPRIWSTLRLDREDIYKLLLKPKSCPLDLFIEPCKWCPHDPKEVDKCIDVFGMIHSQFWRIQSLISDMRLHWGETVMFPKGCSINLPIMQTVSYTRAFTQHDDFPQLRSAILSHSEPIVRSLVANSMQTVSHLLLSYSDDVLVPPLILAR